VRAVILAAGRGTRLGLAGGGPKCLAEVGGRTILSRSLDALDAAGVAATIVVGHAADRIREHVAGRQRSASLVVNERYQEGSVVSLAAGLSAVGVGEDVLLLDGDVVYAPPLLRRLVDAAAPDALLVDVGTTFTDEQFMAGIRGSRVVLLRRGTADGHDAQGEWIGLTRLSAGAAARFLANVSAQIARGETAGGYEDALAGMLTDVAFAAVPTDGLPWVEVDFADDLARARALFT
jgi:choline kinase